MINLFSDVIILIVVLLNFMYILTCLLLYYCNKLAEDLFCLAEQQNNCLSKKVVFISIYTFRYNGFIKIFTKLQKLKCFIKFLDSVKTACSLYFKLNIRTNVSLK